MRNKFLTVVLGILILSKPAFAETQNEIDTLIQKLADKNVPTQSDAAQKLTEIGKPAVEPLIALLKDTNTNSRCWAVSILRAIKDPQSIEPLIGILNDPNFSVQSGAVSALKDITKQDFGNDRKRWQEWFTLSKKPESTEKEWRIYKNLTADFSIRHPSAWKVLEQGNTICIMSPKEDILDDFSENVSIVIDKSNAKSLPLDEYVELGLQNSKKVPSTKLVENGEAIIGKKRAIFLIFTGVGGQNRGKTKQYTLGNSSTKYILTYTAQTKEKYDKFLQQAEKIMKSIEIIGSVNAK